MSPNDSANAPVSWASLRLFCCAHCTRSRRWASSRSGDCEACASAPSPASGAPAAAGFSGEGAAGSKSTRARLSRVSVTSLITPSNRWRNTSSRDWSMVRSCSGVTTSNSQRSLVPTPGPAANAQRSSAFTCRSSFWPALRPSGRTSRAWLKRNSVALPGGFAIGCAFGSCLSMAYSNQIRASP